MLEKNTSDLQQELLSKPNLDRILSENAASFQQESATALLNRLYERTGLPKNRRDAIILHGIAHGTPLMEINDILFQEGEKPLF